MDEELRNINKKEWVATILAFISSLAYIILFSLFISGVAGIGFILIDYSGYLYIFAFPLIAATIISFRLKYIGSILVFISVCGLLIVVFNILFN